MSLFPTFDALERKLSEMTGVGPPNIAAMLTGYDPPGNRIFAPTAAELVRRRNADFARAMQQARGPAPTAAALGRVREQEIPERYRGSVDDETLALIEAMRNNGFSVMSYNPRGQGDGVENSKDREPRRGFSGKSAGVVMSLFPTFDALERKLHDMTEPAPTAAELADRREREIWFSIPDRYNENVDDMELAYINSIKNWKFRARRMAMLGKSAASYILPMADLAKKRKQQDDDEDDDDAVAGGLKKVAEVAVCVQRALFQRAVQADDFGGGWNPSNWY